MKKRISLKQNGKILYGIISMGIVLTIICMVFWKQGIYPFGDWTLVYNDMQYQYLDFFMWFRNVLHGEDSFTYSFYMGQGGNSVSLVAYYLASPLNLLCYFVKPEYMAEFLTLLISLKLALCSLSAYVYLEKRFQLNSFYNCIIAVSYGLMGYNILQCSNVMWLDGVIILPFLALGIYTYIWEGRSGIYFISLFYAVFSNWYIGYMLCLFSVLYFLFEFIYRSLVIKMLHILKEFLKSISGFAVISLLAVGSTFFLFLPQTLHMMNDGEKFDNSIFTPQFGFSVLDGFRDFFLESDKLTWSEGSPPIFIGSFVLVFVVLFFVSKKIDYKKKYLGGVFLGGLMFVFNFRPLNYVFSLFKIPSSHSYRYAFIFSFFMIVVAALCIKEIGEIYSMEIQKAVCILISILVLLDYVKPYSIREQAYLSGLLMVLVGTAMLGCVRKKVLLLTNIVILVCTVTEFYQKMNMEFEDHNFQASVSSEYNRSMQESVANVKKQDGDYYRIDKTFSRMLGGGECNNEGMAFGYSSISSYTSTNNVKVAEMMKACGYTGDTTVVSYMPILAMDSLMGVKYIYSDQTLAGCELLQENIMEGKNLYKNPYALSIGYFVADLQNSIQWEENPLHNQELLYEEILGKRTDLYVPAEVLSVNTDSSNYVQWKLKVNETGPLYVYFSNGQSGMQVYVNDQYVSFNTWYNNQIEYMGEYKKDDIVTVEVKTGVGEYQEDYGICTGTLEMETFQNSIKTIQAEQLKVKEAGKNRMVLEKESANRESVVLTIPYEEGWEIKVNGKDISYFKGLNSFIGLDLPSGKCVIEMEYKVPGQKAGMLVSVFCIMIYMILRRSKLL